MTNLDKSAIIQVLCVVAELGVSWQHGVENLFESKIREEKE